MRPTVRPTVRRNVPAFCATVRANKATSAHGRAVRRKIVTCGCLDRVCRSHSEREREEEREFTLHSLILSSLPLLLSQVACGMRPSGNAGHANGCWSRVFARSNSWVQHRLALLHFIETQPARVGVVRVCMSVRACVCAGVFALPQQDFDTVVYK